MNYIVCILIGLISMITVVALNWSVFEEQTEKRLDTILTEIELYYNNYSASRDRLVHFESDVNGFFAEYLSDFKEKVTQDKIDSFSIHFPNKDIYFVSEDGIVVSNDTANPLPERETLIQEIEDNGYAKIGEVIYAGAPVTGGFLIISDDFTISDELKNLFTVPNSTDDTVCFDLGTHQVIMASQEKVKDMTWDGFLNINARFVKIPVQNNEMGVGYNKTLGYFQYKQKIIDDEILLIAYADSMSVIIDFMRGIAMELVMIPLVILILVKYTRELDENKHQPDLPRKKRNRGKLHLNRNITYPLGAMFTICMLLTVSLTGYMELMSALSDQNVHAVNNLNGLKNRIEQSTQMSRRFGEYHTSNVKEVLELIAWGTEQDPEQQMSKGKLQWITKKLEIDSLMVYDGDGRVIASSEDNIGELLNQDPSSSDAPCQNLLLGTGEYATQSLPNDREYYARTRIGGGGFIRVIYDTTLKKELMALDNFETAFISCDFGEATKLYADLDDPAVIYYENPATMSIERLSFTLPEQLSGDRFNGIMTMEGRFLYVNSMRMDSRIFIHAIPLRMILVPCLLGIVNEFILFTIIFLILVYTTALYSEPAYHKEDGEEGSQDRFDGYGHEQEDTSTHRYFKNIREKMVEKTFKKTVNLLMRVSFAAVAIIFILDGFISDSSLYAYLISNTWTSGVNLFSITKIIIAIIAVWILGSFLQQIILLISGNLNNRGATIGHMLSSIVQFGSIVFFVIYTLVQCGISINSLLAGAGLTGAALAIAGQSVVNDLLSGLFIVFEGKFGVGDWVTIGDWRGQVLEIGVRTTTVGLGDDIKIFNNSTLGGIIVWSHNMCGAICYVDIDYREDVDQVIQLIHENRQSYMDAIPHMAEGPMVQGVTDLGDSGMTLRITAYVKDQRYAGMVQRAVLKETKKLFDEHGIRIPFAQVVVHSED